MSFKVKLSLRLIKHHVMKTYRGVGVYLHHSRPRHLMEVSGQLHAPAASSLVDKTFTRKHHV
jgi:hypothetical protein